MIQRRSVSLVVFSTLLLFGCSGGSDDGGSSGGSGSVPLSLCESKAGVYPNPDGSTLKLLPNCEFVITLEDGSYGHGRFTSLDQVEQSFSYDLVIDTGPSQGTCATVKGTPTEYKVTLKPC